MLNRRHTRIKVMQALYAYYCSDNSISVPEAERELKNSLKKLYELYLYILLFTKELISFAEFYDDEVKARLIPSSREKSFNSAFYTNKVAETLLNSDYLEKKLNNYKLFWNADDNDMLRKIFQDLKNKEIFQDYIRSGEVNGIDEVEVLTFILKHYPENFSLLEQHFEDKYLSWYDDYKIAIQMAIKTFKQIQTDENPDDFLQPFTKDDDVEDFAVNLFHKTVDNEQYLSELITPKIEKWEPSRVALIDIVILKMGIMEFIHFPNIPVKVTINECIELAKNYSTPNSRKFINGVLDNILIEMRDAGQIHKSGIGLVEN